MVDPVSCVPFGLFFFFFLQYAREHTKSYSLSLKETAFRQRLFQKSLATIGPLIKKPIADNLNYVVDGGIHGSATFTAALWMPQAMIVVQIVGYGHDREDLTPLREGYAAYAPTRIKKFSLFEVCFMQALS